MNTVKVPLILAAIAGALSGCSNPAPTPPPPAQSAQGAKSAQSEVVTNNSIVMQISHPDEAMQALASVAQPDDWKKHLDAGTTVSSSEKLKVVAAIGMQSANGVVAQYVGDDANAQKLATSVKGLADRLSLKSAQLESLVAKTTTDFKEPDATRRSALVRTDIIDIQDELKATLDRLGDGPAATMMIFGAWIEGVRMSAGVLQAKYTPAASDVLNRRNEADFFLAGFSAAPSSADPMYAQLKPGLTRIRDAMTADSKTHQVSKASVDAIQAAATELAGLMRK